MRNPKKKLQNECNRLCYENYLKPFCEICKEKEARQLHHFYPKSCYAHLKFEPLNLISLCLICHFRLTHQDKRLEDKIRENRGEKWYKALQKKALDRSQGTFLTTKYYQDILERLKRKTAISGGQNLN